MVGIVGMVGMVTSINLPTPVVAHGATVPFMATVITQRELRNNNADIMRRVEDGETFVITRNGKQVASLRPSRRSSTIATEELQSALSAVQGGDYHDLRHDLDAIADQDPTPRG